MVDIEPNPEITGAGLALNDAMIPEDTVIVPVATLPAVTLPVTRAFWPAIKLPEAVIFPDVPVVDIEPNPEMIGAGLDANPATMPVPTRRYPVSGNIRLPSVPNRQLFRPPMTMVNVAFDVPLVTVIRSPLVYPVPAVAISIVLAYPPVSVTFTVSPVPVPPVVAKLDMGFISQLPVVLLITATSVGTPLGTFIPNAWMVSMLPVVSNVQAA